MDQTTPRLPYVEDGLVLGGFYASNEGSAIYNFSRICLVETFFGKELFMKRITLLLVAVALVAGLVAAWARSAIGADAEPAPRSAKEVRGASPYIEIKDEPAPKLIVDDPLPDLLDQGVVWIQWRVENVHIVPVFGKGALNASPRVGHLHIHVDDLPWWWADASNINTIDLAGMPPGPHTIRIVLVDANHEPFPGQSKTVMFTIPQKASGSHSH